jgi:serine acetyltransferase
MVLRLIKGIVKKIFNSNANKHLGLNIDSSVKIYPNVVFDTKYGGTIDIGKNTELLYGVLLLTYGGNIKIGDNCSINPYTVLYGHGNLTIGNNVLIAGHCLIIPANHNFKDNRITINNQGLSTLGITIGDNVWIGSGCQILDGVTIAEGAIIAAGAVVNKNVDAFTTVGGVPAKLLKDRN